MICDIKGVATLIGVVSWGRKCGSEGYPRVYSDVHKFKDWIESVTNCGDIECYNGGYCEFKRLESKAWLLVRYESYLRARNPGTG